MQALNTSIASPLNLLGEIQIVPWLTPLKATWHLFPRVMMSLFAQTGLPSPPLSLAKLVSSASQSLTDTVPQKFKSHTAEALFTTS